MTPGNWQMDEDYARYANRGGKGHYLSEATDSEMRALTDTPGTCEGTCFECSDESCDRHRLASQASRLSQEKERFMKGDAFTDSAVPPPDGWDDRLEDARLYPVLKAIQKAWNDLPRDASWEAMLEAMAQAAIGAIDTYEFEKSAE